MTTNKKERTLNKDSWKEKEDKQRPPSPASLNAANDSQGQPELMLLEELKKLRKENQEGHNHTKMSLERLEQAVTDIRDHVAKHEERIGQMEERSSATEDTLMRHQRALRHLIHRDLDLSAKCDDLQNRLRRNNIRIFQIPEGSEGHDMIRFISELLRGSLKLPTEMDMKIERAHRSLGPRPTDPAVPPRSIIVRFLDAGIKDKIIQQAWSQKQVFFQDKRIFLDQDYSPDLQKKRARIYEVIKQLKRKNVQAKCLYPAKLRIKLDTGEKTFATLTEAAQQLKEMGVEIGRGDGRHIEEELKEGWRNNRRRQREAALSISDVRVLMQEGH
ncbi:unnamed protein product [Oreochromis niloticus]|nr:unnamed protein product [Mustela putorius furo]